MHFMSLTKVKLHHSMQLAKIIIVKHIYIC